MHQQLRSGRGRQVRDNSPPKSQKDLGCFDDGNGGSLRRRSRRLSSLEELVGIERTACGPSAKKSFSGVLVCTLWTAVALHRTYVTGFILSEVLVPILAISALCVCLGSALFNFEPTTQVGEIFHDRFNRLGDNWRKHTLRSIVEIILWLHVTDVAYEKTDALDSLCLGVISGFFIVVVVHFSLTCVAEVARMCGGHRRVQNAELLTDQQVVCFLLLFVTARQVHYGDGAYMGLATVSGVLMLTLVKLIAVVDSKHTDQLFLKVLKDRIFNSPRNYVQHPCRTLVEVVLGFLSFACSYAILGDVLSSAVVGSACSIEYCCLMIQYEAYTSKEESVKAASPKRYRGWPIRDLVFYGFVACIAVAVVLWACLKRALHYTGYSHICFGHSPAPHCASDGLAHLIPMVWVCAFVVGLASMICHWRPTQRVGELLASRTRSALKGWRDQTLRCFIEVFLWVHVTEVWFEKSDGDLSSAVTVGAVAAVFIYVLVHFSLVLIAELERLCGGRGDSVYSPQLFTDRQLACFLVLFVVARRLLQGSNGKSVGLVMISGASLLFCVRLVALTEKGLRTDQIFVDVMRDRIFNAKRNWARFPVRTLLENVLWCSLFACAYAVLRDGLSAGVVGFSGGIVYSCVMSRSAVARYVGDADQILEELKRSVAASCGKKLRRLMARLRVPGPLPVAPSDAGGVAVVFADGVERAVHRVPHTRNLRVLCPASSSSSSSRGGGDGAGPCDKERKRAEEQLIGIDGQWYDVASFAPSHPGGSVILEFVGKDATSIFRALHSPAVLRRFKPVAGGGPAGVEAAADPAEQDFLALLARMEADGWFRPNVGYFGRKCAVCAALLAGAQLLLWCGGHCVWGAALCLGLLWMQGAYLTHDLMHNQHFQHRRSDQLWGWFWGNVCLGASSVWWRDEHFEHHIFTNTIVPGEGSGDPQQHEAPLFAQDPQLLQFLPHRLAGLLVKVQHLTFLPVLMLFGRVGLCVASYTMQTGWREHLGVALHWAWVLPLLSQCETWKTALGVWYAAALVQGLLGLLLCLGHYDKPFVDKALCPDLGWFRRQVQVTKDVAAPWWMDWFYGGLNTHIVHHLMPRLSRVHYRQADAEIRALLLKHDMQFDKVPFSEALRSVLGHMHKESLFATWKEVFLGS